MYKIVQFLIYANLMFLIDILAIPKLDFSQTNFINIWTNC